MIRLDEHQKEIIYSKESHIIALARAGSGKSTVLIKRAEYFNKVDPGNTLLISFSRDIAEDNEKNKLRELKINSSFNINATTIHGLALKLLNKDRNRKLKLINRNFCISFYRDLFGDYQNDNINKIQCLYKLDSELPRDFNLGDIKQVLNKTRSIGLSLEQIQELIKLVRKERLKYNYILVGEILQQAKFIPKEDWYSIGIKHLLIDEAQDVSLEQLNLVKHIVEYAKTCTVVMDDWQEIYGWAGADCKSLIQQLTALKSFKYYPLLYNYRSGLKIVEIGNRLLSKAGEDNTIKAARREEGLIKFISIDEFKTLINDLHKQNKLSNTVILYRNYKNLDQILPLIEGIPYTQNKNNYSKIVESLFDYYRLLFYIQPPKYVWNSVVNTTKLIDWRVSEYIWNKSCGRPLSKIIIDGQPNLTKLYHTFCDNLRALRDNLTRFKPEDTIDTLLRFSQIKIQGQDLNLLNSYRELFKKCKGIYEVLDVIDSREKNLIVNKDNLLLSSIHKSKGLEYDRVFVWLDQLHGKRGGEELRVEYVAITRAKNELYLVGSNNNSLISNLRKELYVNKHHN